MHELSIAMRILDITADEARRRGGAAVAAVHLRLGPLSGVVAAALQSAYDLAREGSATSRARLVIEEVPVIIFCDACRSEQRIPSIQEFRCPVCGTLTAEVVRGRELEIVALEIEE